MSLAVFKAVKQLFTTLFLQFSVQYQAKACTTTYSRTIFISSARTVFKAKVNSMNAKYEIIEWSDEFRYSQKHDAPSGFEMLQCNDLSIFNTQIGSNFFCWKGSGITVVVTLFMRGSILHTGFALFIVMGVWQYGRSF